MRKLTRFSHASRDYGRGLLRGLAEFDYDEIARLDWPPKAGFLTPGPPRLRYVHEAGARRISSPPGQRTLYRHLDAAQLIKHYLGLPNTFPGRDVTLLYLFWEPADAADFPGFGLSLPFIPSALATEGFCKSLPYAYALFALTDKGREPKDFCGGQSLWGGTGCRPHDPSHPHSSKLRSLNDSCIMCSETGKLK